MAQFDSTRSARFFEEAADAGEEPIHFDSTRKPSHKCNKAHQSRPVRSSRKICIRFISKKFPFFSR